MSVCARRIRVSWIALSLGLTLATGASAVVFTVDSTADEVDDNVGNGQCHATIANKCTLRAAVMEANKSSGIGATIVLPAGTYTFVLPADGDDGPEGGDLDLTTPTSGNPVIVISGAAAATTIIDANQIDRVFSVEANRTASISGVTLRRGFVEVFGATIQNFGTLTVESCTLTGGTAGVSGGALYNEGMVTLKRSTLSGNFAETGGAIDNYGTIDISQSTISGNSAEIGGGGVVNNSTVFLSNSTISSNFAGDDGGGIYNNSGADFWTYNATIAFNEADSDADEKGSGGGVYNSGLLFYPRSSVIMGNTHSGTVDLDDCSGTLSLFGQNALSTINAACTFEPQNADAAYFVRSVNGLGPLQFNGGSTRTHALAAGSGLIDGGASAADCVGSNDLPLPTDQRGGAKGVGTLCDLGAFEFGALPAGLIFTDGFELGNLWAWG